MTILAHTTDDGKEASGGTSQRVDKWLWCARFFKSRSLATAFVNAGGLRLTRAGETLRVAKASAVVRPGDQLTFASQGAVRTIRILACAMRRGPVPEARSLYDDLTLAGEATGDARAGLTGERVGPRPSKKDRRDFDAATRRYSGD